VIYGIIGLVFVENSLCGGDNEDGWRLSSLLIFLLPGCDGVMLMLENPCLCHLL